MFANPDLLTQGHLLHTPGCRTCHCWVMLAQAFSGSQTHLLGGAPNPGCAFMWSGTTIIQVWPHIRLLHFNDLCHLYIWNLKKNTSYLWINNNISSILARNLNQHLAPSSKAQAHDIPIFCGQGIPFFTSASAFTAVASIIAPCCVGHCSVGS